MHSSFSQVVRVRRWLSSSIGVVPSTTGVALTEVTKGLREGTTGTGRVAGMNTGLGMGLVFVVWGKLLPSAFGRCLVSHSLSTLLSWSHASILVAFCWRLRRDVHSSRSANRSLT